MGYTKLFTSILASSVWQEPLPTKIVWITMLALKNERHEVEASLPGLAKLAGVTMKECEEAIRKFEQPDKYSRNPENDGRKVMRSPVGWIILNGDYYSRLMSTDERREYQRIYQKEYRKRRKHLNTEAVKDGAKDAIADGVAERAEALPVSSPVEPVQVVAPPNPETPAVEPVRRIMSIEEAKKYRDAKLIAPAPVAPPLATPFGGWAEQDKKLPGAG